uniref:Uncharacterized protein n=1 Tax=viral metagenome TaxID=1070528 RepID=A0A6M3ISU3_9ZZZZ
MSIGEDIKGALQDIGTTITIYRDSGNLSGEYIDYEPNAQVTKPFIREFFLESMVSYDTNLISGDAFRLDKTGEDFLLMNKTPVVIENAVSNYDCVLYKCNVSGEILRPSGEVRSTQTYHKVTSFISVETECFALMTEPLFSGDLDTDEQLGLIGMQKNELYIPKTNGIQVLDRFQPVSGEYYMVDSIKIRRFPGIDVAILSEDTR